MDEHNDLTRFGKWENMIPYLLKDNKEGIKLHRLIIPTMREFARFCRLLVRSCEVSDAKENTNEPWMTSKVPCKCIYYSEFRKLIRCDTIPQSITPFLSACTFLRLCYTSDNECRVDCRVLIGHLCRVANKVRILRSLFTTRKFLEPLSSENNGKQLGISKIDLENWIFIISKGHSQLHILKSCLLPFWVFYCTNVFRFAFDVYEREEIIISLTAFCSGITANQRVVKGYSKSNSTTFKSLDDEPGFGLESFSTNQHENDDQHIDLLSIFVASLQDAESDINMNLVRNFNDGTSTEHDHIETTFKRLFGIEAAICAYVDFTVFGTSDTHQEINILDKGYMNPIFVSRLLERYSYFTGEMDYKTFSIFHIAWQLRQTSIATLYFWGILDPNMKGFVTLMDMQEIAEGLYQVLIDLSEISLPEIQVLCSELIDLMTTKSHSDTSRTDQGLQREALGDAMLQSNLLKARNPMECDCRLDISHAMSNPSTFGILVGVLANTNNFIEYECREEMILDKHCEKEAKLDVESVENKIPIADEQSCSLYEEFISRFNDATFLPLFPATIPTANDIPQLETFKIDCEWCNINTFSQFLDTQDSISSINDIENSIEDYYYEKSKNREVVSLK